MFYHRVEGRTRDEPIQFRQHDLQLLKNTLPLRCWLITLGRPHQQIFMKRISHSLKSAAHRRLTQQQLLGGARYVAFFGEHREDNKEIQVGLA